MFGVQTSKAGSLPHEKGKIRIIKARLFFLLKAISKRSIDIYGIHIDPLCMYINMHVHISKLVSCMSNKRYQEQSESNQNKKKQKTKKKRESISNSHSGQRITYYPLDMES